MQNKNDVYLLTELRNDGFLEEWESRWYYLFTQKDAFQKEAFSIFYNTTSKVQGVHWYVFGET